MQDAGMEQQALSHIESLVAEEHSFSTRGR